MIQLSHSSADIFIPDQNSSPFERITHLGIGAHHDDLEFMAVHGILECFQREDRWFGGVTCTNGAGSARIGRYEAKTDEEMQVIRRHEQNLAASIGQYAAMLQLAHPSNAIKTPDSADLRADLAAIFGACTPRVVYTHNLADKHETHIGIAVAVIEVLRELSPERRPQAVYGCEVWRDLDWMPDDEKIVLDVSGHDHIIASLNGVFDSQIGGGKRYDLGVVGRRRANATFYQSHQVDRSDSLAFAMDMTPLISNPDLDILEFTTGFIDRFRADVTAKLRHRLGR